MTTKMLTRAVLLATAASMALASLPVSAAAQGYNQPPPDSNDGPPPDYRGPPPDDNRGPPPDYDHAPPAYTPPSSTYDRGPSSSYDDNGPPSDYAAEPPPGYRDGGSPPPPPGYDAGAPDPAQQQQDARYARYAERWAEENCVKAHGDVAGGAFIGGLFGALIGAGLAGHGDRGGGALAGAAIGGIGGAAIASSAGSDATSPGCPHGYVVRDGAPDFYYASGPYDYAAPGWYDPWVWGEDRWIYRPYPYHVWYYRHYSRGERDWHDHDHWRDRDDHHWR